MTRIVTNVQSLIAQRNLGAQNLSLNKAMTRLSTGLRINVGADDPAGLIASESLRAEKVAINAAVNNARRADNVLSIAEGSLIEVNRLLLDLEGLVDRTASIAGLSEQEIKANQSQIDAILQSIDRVANTVEFNGNKLLGGAYDFVTSGVTASEINTSLIKSAKIPHGATRTVTVEVVIGSTLATISGAGGGVAGSLSAATSLLVGGNYGSEVLSFASGTTLTSMATAINEGTELTGVTAAVSANGALYFSSVEYGDDAFASVSVLSGQFTTSTGNDTGSDGAVVINGTSADVDGLNVSTSTATFAAEFTLDSTFGSTDGGSTSFEITGGGARFNIAPEVSMVGMENLGIQSVATGALGDTVSGYLTTLGSGAVNDLSSGNFATAQRVVQTAQNQVSNLRGRLGGFQKNTLHTAVNSLLIALENTAAAESAIRETDFAETISDMTRAQILVNTSMSSLQFANSQPQSVLTLLG